MATTTDHERTRTAEPEDQAQRRRAAAGTRTPTGDDRVTGGGRARRGDQLRSGTGEAQDTEARTGGRSAGQQPADSADREQDASSKRDAASAQAPGASASSEEPSGGAFSVVRILAITIAAVVLVAPVAWLCLQMGAPVTGGRSVLLIAFAAIIASAIVAAVPLAIRDLRSRSHD